MRRQWGAGDAVWWWCAHEFPGMEESLTNSQGRTPRAATVVKVGAQKIQITVGNRFAGNTTWVEPENLSPRVLPN